MNKLPIDTSADYSSTEFMFLFISQKMPVTYSATGYFKIIFRVTSHQLPVQQLN